MASSSVSPSSRYFFLHDQICNTSFVSNVVLIVGYIISFIDNKQAALPQGIVPFVFAKEYNVHPDILSTA